MIPLVSSGVMERVISRLKTSYDMKEENTNTNWHLVFRRGLTSLYIIIIIPGSLVN